MWNTIRSPEDDGRIIKLKICRNGQIATWSEILAALAEDFHLADVLDACIRDIAFEAVRWETPPITVGRLTSEFEFVLIDSPQLTGYADVGAFAKHFGAAENHICVFPNLGGDATLVVPSPTSDLDAYVHLSAFSRNASKSQRRDLWQTVGRTVSQKLGVNPIWVNTAGAGVAWLHVRIDTRPKYYQYGPYKHACA